MKYNKKLKVEIHLKNIFISYAWNEEEDEKVIRLAEMLEEYIELNVKFDKWDMNKGQELPLFMEEGVQQSDFVLIVCSKRYKENADKRIGGSGYEARLMSDEILRNTDRDRFIPILLNEYDKNYIPNFLTGRLWTSLYYDENSKNYNNEINDLLATIVGHSKKSIRKNKSIYDQLTNVCEKVEDIGEKKILGIKQEEVTVPKLDGTRGSALYSIPFLLNQRPPKEWRDIFINKWNYPRQSTTMHRSGIARIVEDKIILDGTTIQEVKNYHRDTLILCVNDANEDYKVLIDAKLVKQQNEIKKIKDFRTSLSQNIDDITF